MKNKHYLVYQITNLINDKVYIGVHITQDVDDGYMGSGTHLRRSLKKYGLENFNKEILFDFDNPEDMLNKEIELVDRKFISRKDTYNIALGGVGWNTFDTIPVVDKEGNQFRVHKSDERYLSGELVFNLKNKIVVKDCDGVVLSVDKNDERFKSGELVGVSKGTTTVIDKFGKIFKVSVEDKRLKTGELVGVVKNMVNVIDSSGEVFRVLSGDERFASGEIRGITYGTTHTQKTKKRIGQANSVHQKGSGNSQYGTCWIRNELESKKIKKFELESYLERGWVRGRRIKI